MQIENALNELPMMYPNNVTVKSQDTLIENTYIFNVYFSENAGLVF